MATGEWAYDGLSFAAERQGGVTLPLGGRTRPYSRRRRLDGTFLVQLGALQREPITLDVYLDSGGIAALEAKMGTSGHDLTGPDGFTATDMLLVGPQGGRWDLIINASGHRIARGVTWVPAT